MAADGLVRALSWATDIDVLPGDRVVERRSNYWVIRSPSNPHHWWGNFLLFDEPPRVGDGVRWESAFAAEIEGSGAGSGHRAFGWDVTDGTFGAVEAEFVRRGYERESTVGLVARPDELLAHPRENRDVVVRELSPVMGADQPLWDQVVALQVAGRDPRFEDAASYGAFCAARLADLRKLFEAGRGAWFVALAGDQRTGAASEVAGSLGVVVTDGRARYQIVDTAQAHRRRGICSRLVVEAARRIAAARPVRHFVICADPDYHALGLYESLGFRRAERVAAVLRRPAQR